MAGSGVPREFSSESRANLADGLRSGEQEFDGGNGFTEAVAVSTLEAVKPAETPAFSGDAWAAAMSAGVEEKIAEAEGSRASRLR